MEHRQLGRTGVSVSKFCLGRDDVRGVGQPRSRRVDPRSSTRRWTPGSTSSTPPTSTGQGESEEIVGKALAGAAATT